MNGGVTRSLSQPADRLLATAFTLLFLAPGVSAFGLFVVHRIEENQSDFFARVAAVTGIPTLDVFSVSIILLVAASVGAWLSIPFLVKRGAEFPEWRA